MLRLTTLTAWIKRKLGIYTVPPPEPRNACKAEDLRRASASKDASAEKLEGSGDTEIDLLSARKREDARMLRELAEELELDNRAQ